VTKLLIQFWLKVLSVELLIFRHVQNIKIHIIHSMALFKATNLVSKRYVKNKQSLLQFFEESKCN